jgi:hypothetical protein
VPKRKYPTWIMKFCDKGETLKTTYRLIPFAKEYPKADILFLDKNREK